RLLICAYLTSYTILPSLRAGAGRRGRGRPRPTHRGAFMAAELVQNPWGVIVRPRDDVLELRWLPSTASMSDGGFMATLCLFAWEAERARPLGLLIDAVEFGHQFGPGVVDRSGAAFIFRVGDDGARTV